MKSSSSHTKNVRSAQSKNTRSTQKKNAKQNRPATKQSPFNVRSEKRQHERNSVKNRNFTSKPRPENTVIILFNKPFDVLTQFTDDQNRKTLKDFIDVPDVYAAGRLDKDSEGLLVLTNDGQVQHQLANPKNNKRKTYWVQVEGAVTADAIESLTNGVILKDGLTKPATVRVIEQPDVWERIPPIRERKNIPTTWLEMIISEGKNRQVRRMTAHVGFPTLRLIRTSVGPYQLDQLAVGDYKMVSDLL